LDNHKTYGYYIVGQGKDFKIKERYNYYDYERHLDPELWYIVHIDGKIVGKYESRLFAVSLAQGMNRVDQHKLDVEIERILRDES